MVIDGEAPHTVLPLGGWGHANPITTQLDPGEHIAPEPADSVDDRVLMHFLFLLLF